jgi:hypothetical protein
MAGRDNSMAEDDITKKPEKSPGDIVLDVTKTALAPVPFVGAMAVQFLNSIVMPPIQRRYADWITSIAERLVALEEKVEGFRRADLEGDEGFGDSFARASQAVISSHQKEKLEAIRNAVLNSALPGRPDDDMRAMFLTRIDALTPNHIRLLALLDNPMKWFAQHGIEPPHWEITGSIPGVINHAFPELREKEEFVSQLINELNQYGYIRISKDTLGVTMTPQGALSPHTTKSGEGFIKFISDPEDQ